MEKLHGLNTLGNRLQRVEERIFESKNNLISKIKNKHESQQQVNLDKMNTNYKVSLFENIEDLSDNNIIEIIVFTIKYVKQNIDSISKLLQIKTSDDLILFTIISLLEIDHDAYSSDMLLLSVTSLLKIIILTPEPVKDIEPVKKYGLMRKKSMLVL